MLIVIKPPLTQVFSLKLCEYSALLTSQRSLSAAFSEDESAIQRVQEKVVFLGLWI